MLCFSHFDVIGSIWQFSRWLWWIMCVVLLNQKRRKYFEWIVTIMIWPCSRYLTYCICSLGIPQDFDGLLHWETNTIYSGVSKKNDASKLSKKAHRSLNPQHGMSCFQVVIAANRDLRSMTIYVTLNSLLPSTFCPLL